MKPLENPKIYPRPFGLPRMEPDGRCCAGLVWAEKNGSVKFERAIGGFTIINPEKMAVTYAGLVALERVALSFCSFCGFQYNERAPENQLLEQRTTPPSSESPR